MDSHLSVDYEQLVRAYQESLTTVLRGFRPPAELLETWVPDEDDAKSILNIMEAAQGAGLAGISIYIGPSTVRKLDLVRLSEAAGQRGTVQMGANGDGTLLHISFSSAVRGGLTAPLDESLAAKGKPQQGARNENDIRAPRKALSARVAARSGARAVHPAYRDKLRKELELCACEGTLVPEDGLELVRASCQDTTLMALIEPRQHVVKKTVFDGKCSDEERAVLSLLCKFMEGRPILECSDHAMIYVEHELRDGSLPAPVRGIVTPENADPIFSLPTYLVREVLAGYRRRTGFDSTANLYDVPPSAEWLALTERERVARIQAAIARHLLGGGIEVVRTEGAKRVAVRCGNGLSSVPIATRLIDIEDYVHAEVEPTLELEAEPRPDANRIRRIKEIQLTKL